ncbi:MAG: hypothetical protein V4550_02485 [Gemmatimonadota bacterium]
MSDGLVLLIAFCALVALNSIVKVVVAILSQRRDKGVAVLEAEIRRLSERVRVLEEYREGSEAEVEKLNDANVFLERLLANRD